MKKNKKQNPPISVVSAKELEGISSDIEKSVKRMLKEDLAVGRWVRLTFPSHFNKFLIHAKIASDIRKRETKKGMVGR